MGCITSSENIMRKNSLLTNSNNDVVLKSSMVNDYYSSVFRLATYSSQLQFTLNHPTGRALLMNFLQQEQSVENLKFYDDVVNFRRLFLPLKPVQLVDIRNKAVFIMTMYVQDNSPFQVPLPFPVKDSYFTIYVD